VEIKMTDMMYKLVLRAKFENEQELERVIHGLKQLEVQGAKVNVSMGTAGREGATGLDSLARSALRVGFMFNMLESAYMRVTMGQMMVTRGQQAYNKAVERYGKNSEQAREAAKRLELQTNYLNMANMRANISMGLLITQLALQSNLLKGATLSQIAHTVATKAATLADWLHVAALKAKAILLAATQPWMAPVMIGAGVAVATGIGAGIITQPSKQRQNVEINVNVTQQGEDFDEMWKNAGDKAREEYRSAAGG